MRPEAASRERGIPRMRRRESRRLITGEVRYGGAVKVVEEDRESAFEHFGMALERDEFDGLFYRSEEHTSELQSHVNLVCRLLLEKKKKKKKENNIYEYK